MIIENEYRVIGPPGCIAGDAIISVNRIGVGDAGITRKMRLDYLVERFNSAVPGGYFRGNGYARKTTTLWDSLIKTRVRCMSPEGLILLAPLVRAIDSGLQEVHEVVLEDGCKLRATHDHEFAVVGGMASLSSLAAGDLLMVDAGVARKDPAKKKSYLEIEGLKYHPFCHRVAAKRYSVLVHRLTVEADMNGVSLQFFVDSHRNGFAGNANWRYLQKTQVVHHKDRDVKNNSIGNLEVIDSLTEHSRLHCNEGRWKDVIAKASTCKIAKINKYVGEYPVFDLTVYVEDGKSGNYLANDIVVSNCGKTTYLSSQVKQRVDRWCSDTGESAKNCTDVLVSSLTKAAANEVLSRGLELPNEQIGTLHAHALHALGNPKLCVGPKQISQWNKESKMDHWLGGGVSERNEDGFDIGAGKYRGDSLNAEYTINRCRLVPREQWNQDVVDFATAYERWKYKNDYLDYTDLIHRAYERKVAPPGNPSTILVDECQDHDRAELRLLRYWATCVNKLIIVGDPDQNLYEWRGSDPGGFYESQIPPGQTKVLEQSYRVPRRVHSEAMQMIARSQDRTPVIYHPRDEEGEVDHACYSMRHHPQEVTRHIDELLQEPDSAPGRPKVMCLFSCAYMTNPLCAALRADGIPFWNPYSKERGNFNPLHPSKGVSTVQRLLAFLKPSRDCYGDQAKLWNWSEFHSWVELCTADGWLRHGAKANIKRRAAETPTQVMSLEDIDGVLARPAVMQDLQDVNLDFLGRFISDQKVNAYNFAVDVVRRRGYNDLLTNPRVVVGTIHSVKGAEADHVILCPDLSTQGWETFGTSTHRDSIHRLFYVGLTRAYRRLVLTAPSTPQAVQW